MFNKYKKDFSWIKKIWCYEVWSAFNKYDRLVDISDFIQKKSASINAHKSQLEYKNYTEGMIGLNRYRAIFHKMKGKTRMKYAEVFIKFPI